MTMADSLQCPLCEIIIPREAKKIYVNKRAFHLACAEMVATSWNLASKTEELKEIFNAKKTTDESKKMIDE